MTAEPEHRRTCPRCQYSYPAAYEECPWCGEKNEEF